VRLFAGPLRELTIKKLILVALFLALPAAAEDTRQLVKLTPAAQEVLRQEMFDNLVALNEILALVAENKVKEAGEAAESKLGKRAMGKNATLPFESRPGPQMPAEMHNLGRNGHFAASEFAAAAAGGNRARALALLPNLTANCVACHASYRTR